MKRRIRSNYYYMTHDPSVNNSKGNAVHTDRWAEFLLSGIDLSEGIKLIDYGCGAASLSNYLSGKLDSFGYFGFEPDGEFGTRNITFAKNKLGHDSRIKYLGFISDKDALNNAMINSEYAILGSVFTHLDIKTIREILLKFENFINNGGIVYATMFIGHPNRSNFTAVYDDAFSWTYFTEKQIDNLITQDLKFSYKVKEEKFNSLDGHLHHLYVISK